MLKKEKILLKTLVDNYKIGSRVNTSNIYDKVELTKIEVNSICDSFRDKGLVSDDDYTKFMDGHRSFKFTYQLFDYWNNRRDETSKFIMGNIIVPIIVGIASSVVTSIILNFMS